MTEEVVPLPEGIELVSSLGGDTFSLCYQCGLCDTVCPWNRVKSFLVRRLLRGAHYGVPEIDKETIWQCAACGKCVSRCPRGVGIVDIVVSFRRIASTYNMLPKTIRAVRGNLSSEGNPWGGTREARGGWARENGYPEFSKGCEILYFACCSHVYDKRLSRVSGSIARLLRSAGVSYGVLGEGAVCCGESIRKAGEEELFRNLAIENIRLFIERGVKEIVVSSPHCLSALGNDYREFMVQFPVRHISEYLLKLVEEGRLKIRKEYPRKVTYHDPCFLGRHNGIYDQPRELLRGVPGLELVEMSEAFEESQCCGGGGSRIWMDSPKGERLSDIRLQQAVRTGAAVLATSCPYCMMNFEDSRQDGGSGAIEIVDVTEILSEVV